MQGIGRRCPLDLDILLSAVCSLPSVLSYWMLSIAATSTKLELVNAALYICHHSTRNPVNQYADLVAHVGVGAFRPVQSFRA